MDKFLEHGTIDVSSTLGVLEVGVTVSIFLFGVATVQTFIYYRKFSNDRSLLKAFVGAIWITELVHAIVITHLIYNDSVIKYGDPAILIALPTSGDIAVFLTGLICPAVQAFFVHRIRVLSSKWLFPCALWFLCLLRSIGNIALGAVSHDTLNLLAIKDKWQWMFVTTLAISEAIDVLIAVSLCYYLWPHRDISKRTRVMVDKLIAWTIQTGLITSVATTIQLILFMVEKNYAWVAVFLIIPRLSSNSLMASLNSRTTLCSTNETSGLKFNSNLNMGQSTHPTEINLAITTVTEQRNLDAELGKPHGANFV